MPVEPLYTVLGTRACWCRLRFGVDQRSFFRQAEFPASPVGRAAGHGGA